MCLERVKRILRKVGKRIEEGMAIQYYTELYSNSNINRDEYLMLLKELRKKYGEQGEAENE